MNKSARKVDALLFDKDGTLFDFHATWSEWAGAFIDELADGDNQLKQSVADAMHYDLDARRYLPSSPIIAGTNREAAECIAKGLPGRSVDEIEDYLMHVAADAPQAEAVPLKPFLSCLAGQGLRLGVATNDSEFGARANLDQFGLVEHFDFIAGFDSGFGSKPAPGQLLAFAELVGLPPHRVGMVGDSSHDLHAGRAAGMQTIAVLTGTATRQELAPLADVVLPDIGHILDWLSE